MLNKITEKYNVDLKKIRIIIGIVFLIFMLLVIFLTSSNNKKEENVEIDNYTINSLFDKINDNYTFKIEKTIDGISTILYYNTDSKRELYEINEDVYLINNKKVYLINPETRDVKKLKSKLDFMDDKYYDITLIKNMVKYCDYVYVNPVKAKCSIKYSDFLNEYNTLFGTNYSSDFNNLIDINVVYYEDEIGKIIIDYSGIDKIINNKHESIIYGIKIESINQNDYSVLIDGFGKKLN